jgi:hypothetical protein
MPITVNGGAPLVPVAPFVLLKELESFIITFVCEPPPSYAFVSATVETTRTDSGVTISEGATSTVSGMFLDPFPPDNIEYAYLQDNYVTNIGAVSTWEAYEALTDPTVGKLTKFECSPTTVVDTTYTVTATYVHTVTSAPLSEVLVQLCKVEMAWEYHGQKVIDYGGT